MRKLKFLPLLLAAALLLGTVTACGKENKVAYIAVGDIVCFGRYPQSEITDIGGLTEGVDYIMVNSPRTGNEDKYYAIEPIAWRVLENTDKGLLLLSEMAIDSGRAYHDDGDRTNWGICTIRAWLNNASGESFADRGFMSRAFTDAEQAAIHASSLSTDGIITHDKVFLLSVDEAKNSVYGFSADEDADASRIAYNTGYLSAVTTNTGYGGDTGAANFWWLRSLCSFSSDNAAMILDDGSVNTTFKIVATSSKSVAVRPALRLDPEFISFTSEESAENPGVYHALATA